MIQLFASDLDGTLLNTNKKVSSLALSLINRLIVEKNIIFVAASGRQLDNMLNLFSPIKDQIYYICENGCFSFFKGRIINLHVMETQMAKMLIQDIEQSQDCETLVSGIHTSYIQDNRVSFLHYVRDEIGNNVTPVHSLLDIQEPYFKISLYNSNGIEGLSQKWHKKYDSCFHVATGGNCWLDIMPFNVTKKTGMIPILEQLQIKPDNCLMVGDNRNDIELLDYVGMPFTMNNAVKDVYNRYHYHTSSVEELMLKILNQ